MSELKSSKEYLLKFQSMMQKRKVLVEQLFSKRKLLAEINSEVKELLNQVEDIDKRITVQTIK